MLLGQMFHIPVVLAMTYLAHGRPVVLMNFEPRETLQAIEAERVSAFLGITTMLNYMMAVEDFDRYDLSSLRLIKYGGGPMAESVVREIMERFPCDLMQGYGQTEGCTMSTLPPWVHREIRAGIGTHRAGELRARGAPHEPARRRRGRDARRAGPLRRSARSSSRARRTWSATGAAPTSPPRSSATAAAGCGRATWPRGTRTGSSTSSTAPRTW